jgi:hypothetical protein
VVGNILTHSHNPRQNMRPRVHLHFVTVGRKDATGHAKDLVEKFFGFLSLEMYILLQFKARVAKSFGWPDTMVDIN